MWYTTLIIIFFHHIIIFFERIGLLIKLATMKDSNLVYFKGSMLSSSVKGSTPDLGILKGNKLIFYKFLTYPKRYSMLWFRNEDELLVIRKYYMFGYPRSISPDQKKLPFTYNKNRFNNKLSLLIPLDITVEYRFVFSPMHLGVKYEDAYIGNFDTLFGHIAFINNKAIISELKSIDSLSKTSKQTLKQSLNQL